MGLILGFGSRISEIKGHSITLYNSVNIDNIGRLLTLYSRLRGPGRFIGCISWYLVTTCMPWTRVVGWIRGVVGTVRVGVLDE